MNQLTTREISTGRQTTRPFNWSVLEPRRRGSEYSFPTVRVAKGGDKLTLNRPALGALGDPKAAVLLIDPESGAMAIRGALKTDQAARVLGKYGAITVSRLTDAVALSEATTYRAEYDEESDMLIFTTEGALS